MDAANIGFLTAGLLIGFGLGGLTGFYYFKKKIEKRMQNMMGGMGNMLNTDQDEDEGLF